MAGLLTEINQRYLADNRLHAVIFELTHACCCDCRHCLLVREPSDELTLEEVTGLLDQFAREGVFNLGFTGGEPFLRPDLPEILAAARRHRFFVSVLTTGMLIGEPEVAMLETNGVHSLEISLLGAEPATHDGLMRRPGALARTLRAVEMLHETGMNICLKATVMRPNHRELPAMAALADRLGVQFSATVAVSPRVDGDRSPQDLALTAAEVAGLDPALIGGGPIPDEDFSGGAVLACHAGRIVAGVSPRGEIYPCILMRRQVGDLRQRTLQEIWHDDPDPFLKTVRALTEQDVGACHGCDLRDYCRRCPGVTLLETGDLRAPSPSGCVCATGIAAACGVTDKGPAGP